VKARSLTDRLGWVGGGWQRGLIPRCISDLFNSIKSHPQMAVTVRVAHCEIYNEQFFDLLAPHSRADIQVMEDAKGAVFVKGLSYHVAAR
jgi:hypothetical protein